MRLCINHGIHKIKSELKCESIFIDTILGFYSKHWNTFNVNEIIIFILTFAQCCIIKNVVLEFEIRISNAVMFMNAKKMILEKNAKTLYEKFIR